MVFSLVKKYKKPKKEKRVTLVLVIFFLFSLLIIFRLFNLQILQHQFYMALASKSHQIYKSLIPERGLIFVKEKDSLYPLVTNKEYYLVYAEPNKIQDSKEIVDKITPILNLKEEEWKELLGKLADKNDPYYPIEHKITGEQKKAIENLELVGIDFLPESYRYYSEKNIGGHIFGFVSLIDNERKGQYGLEGYFDKELAGKSGLIKSAKDALGSLITIGDRFIQKAENGSDLVLTIDRTIQFTVCQKLKEYVQRFSAEGGTVIVMESKTGAIIALCSMPDFDPENYNKIEDIKYFNNPAIFSAYEPGSVFKPITMAAALDLGLVTPQTTYIDEGKVKVGPYTIRNSDSKAYGEQTMTQVLEKSLNLGAIFVADKIGRKEFRRYLKDFGFGSLTNITLEKEMPGDISPLDKPGEIYTLTASYGQGITVTPLQLVTAFAAIANDGNLVKPYIIEEIIKSDGKRIKTYPQIIRQVIASKTAAILTGMLVSVVENGWGKKAAVKGYYVAGKTGTAQIPQAGGGYSQETIHTFAGYAPANNPKFVMLVRLDKPQGVRFAESSATPLFGQLAKFLLNYYQIPPER